eukprot:CAMPEP_0174348526 /NCGR_PEP_ID=MMETSP0811_2-20130205/5035_1 /TAXON_ID=73025 ORGANISM="Eutreptiella gymnastica-like, Strain CCMP1594" /NCGR_SAMPLE_ID=MMETSP0811_2 /ASSEMBLY_ACC=CAM_ASM_000667 /LENGTH=60 /DNA_ID=CAMNT_0015475153 /DNA_START=871 /DNA_END=1049 /DNA_ORIENTATION=-
MALLSDPWCQTPQTRAMPMRPTPDDRIYHLSDGLISSLVNLPPILDQSFALFPGILANAG